MLSNFDLMDIAKKHKIKLKAVLSKDMIPAKLEPGSYIINLQDENDGGGTHWVLLEQLKNGTIYMDPFGVVPPPIIEHSCRRPLEFLKTQIQPIESEMCGWYCLYFMDFLKDTKNIEDVIKNFNKKDVEKNDDILKKHFNLK